jgi:glycosyltransferase involved in cell wall biosynthesis
VHVALVTQNADLELDLRPRAEAQALAEAGYRVTLVGGTHNPERVRELAGPSVGVATYRMPKEAASARGQVVELGTSFTLMTRTLVGLARAGGVDVVHASNPPDNVWLVPALLRPAQRTTPRFVFDQHDVAPVLLAEKYGRSAVMRGLEGAAAFLERRSFAAASLVVMANPEYRRRAETEGLLRGPCAVVPNGWSLPEVEPDRRWRDGAEHLLAYVGAINEQDYVDHLVEAVAQLPADAGVRVCVAGDGAGRPEAERRARELGVEERIRWLGWLYGRDEIASLVRSADVCVAPERDTEFNRLASLVKLAEYMSAGAAIAGHRLAQTEALCGDTIDYADDDEAGGLARSIQRLLGDPDRRRSLGAAARERFRERIAWESVGAPALVGAYREVFGEPR